MNPLVFGAALLGAVGVYKIASASKGTEKALPDALAKQMADAIAALGFADGDHLTGTPTAKAVQDATMLASTLADMGFPQHAAYLRGYIETASKKLPTPAAQVPTGLTAAEADQMRRILSLERDPVKLRQAAAWLRGKTTAPEAQQFAAQLEALATQVESAKLTVKTQVAVDEVMKGNPEPTFTTTSVPVPTPVAPKPTPVVAPSSLPLPGAGPASWTPKWTYIAEMKSRPTIKKGSRGDAVKTWQTFLGITADGNFGSGTHTATVAWQAANGLVADGIVGAKTWAKAANETSVSPAATSPIATSLDVPGIVNQAQQAAAATANYAGLPQLASAISALPAVTVPSSAQAVATHLLALQAKYGMPGAKGKEDKTLVKRFQADNSLSQDGKMGPGSTALLAKLGVGNLPLVMYWTKGSGQAGLQKYRDTVNKIASDADLGGNKPLADAIRASAAREKGQGGL